MATRERTSRAIKSEAHMRRVSWTLVRAGAKFEKGLLAERPGEAGMKVAA